MPIDQVLKPLFESSVTITKRSCSHSDGYPKPSYLGNSCSYSAHIESGETLVRLEEGQVVVSRRKVFLYSSTGWATTHLPRVTDKITLPATHPPINPQILSVAPVSDDKGIHHILLLTEP